MKQESATNAQVFAGPEEITHDLVAATGEAGDLPRDLGSQTLESARETLDRTRTAMRGQAQKRGAVLHGYANTYPWRFIAVAAVVGVVAGALLARR